MAIDPQGYPVQEYTNLRGDVVLQVFSDGTIVFINGIIIATSTGSPEGVVTAKVGSMYIQSNGVAPNILWQKQTGTGNTGWVAIGGGGGGGAVTSVFGRVGAVVADANDYSAVTDLFLGDGNSSIAFTTAGGSINLSDGVGANLVLFGTNDALLTAFTGGLLSLRGATIALADVGGGNTATVTINGAAPILDGIAQTDLQITDGVSQGLSFGTGSGEVSLTDGTGNDSFALDGAGQAQVNGDTIIALAVTQIQLNSPTVSLPTLPQVFADNAAAVTGGLNAGDIYRTGDDPDVLCIVH